MIRLCTLVSTIGLASTLLLGMPTISQAQNTGLCRNLENCCDYAAGTQCAPADYTLDRLSMVVGVDQYETEITDTVYRDLKNAVNDAREIGRVFASNGVETRFVFNPNLLELQVELFRLATHVRESEAELRLAGFTERPFVKLYFAGHGLRGEDGRDYLILPINQPQFTARDDFLMGTDAVAGFFSGLKQFDVTFVFDACRTFVSLPPDSHSSGRGTGQSFGSPDFFPANVSQYLTVLSTAPLTPASDVAPDREDLGLFARYFTYFLEKPGLQFQDVLALTGWFVKAANPGQEPQFNSSPAPGINGRRLIDISTTDTCAMAEVTLFDELKQAPMCGTYSPGQNPACVEQVAKVLLQAAGADGMDLPGFLQQCPILDESLALLDPTDLVLAASESITPAVPEVTAASLPTIRAEFQPPAIVLGSDMITASWANSSDPQSDALTQLYAFAGQSQTSQALIEGLIFPDRPDGDDRTRSGNLSKEIESLAGVPINVPGALTIRNAPSSDADWLFTRLPDGGTARLDCINARCNEDFLGITVYQNDGQLFRGFVEANDLYANAAPPTNRIRRLIRFEEYALTARADQVSALADALRSAPPDATVAIWSQAQVPSANAFLTTRIRTSRLLEELETEVPEQQSLRSRVSELTLTDSQFGPNAFIVELIYN